MRRSADKEAVEFPSRDVNISSSILRSQSGQAIVEYILVLIVTVALVLGGIYQLNSAFKVWANNYFGDYLACLLETGELPSIGGSPGDSGTCNTLFKAFSLSDGKPLLPQGVGASGSGGSSAGTGAGSREKSSGGGGGGTGGSIPLPKGAIAQGAKGGAAGGAARSIPTNTGSTKATSYGGYSQQNQKPNTPTKERLDNHFAFENEKAAQEKRSTASASRSSSDSANNSRIRIHHKENKKDNGEEGDTQMTFGNFMKYLIIAALVIALIVVIGGQMLSIGKSMDD